MYKDIVVINEKEHKNKGVKSLNHFSYAKELTSCILMVDEYFEACKNYPIVFAKNDKDGWFSLVIMGLDKENKFVDKEGNWSKFHYIPAFVRRYPFIYVEKDDELLLGVDKSMLVDKKKSNKRYFFEKGGKHTPFVLDVINFMNTFQHFSKETKRFIEELDRLGLLEESNITRQKKDKEEKIGGFWIVSEKKLNELEKKDKDLLCKENFIPLITAHLISLSNIQKLSI